MGYITFYTCGVETIVNIKATTYTASKKCTACFQKAQIIHTQIQDFGEGVSPPSLTSHCALQNWLALHFGEQLSEKFLCLLNQHAAPSPSIWACSLKELLFLKSQVIKPGIRTQNEMPVWAALCCYIGLSKQLRRVYPPCYGKGMDSPSQSTLDCASSGVS